MDSDKAYDQHRQDCADKGICHFCEGYGCPRCKPKQWRRIENADRDELMQRLATTETALQRILNMDSCLLADAQAIAKEALDD